MRLIVSAILILGTSAPLLTEAGVPFNGKKGEALIRSIGACCRPVTLVGTDRLNATYQDPFTGQTIEIRSGSLPAGYEWGCMVPAEWWDNARSVYGDTVSRDLHNILPLSPDVRTHRGGLPPGTVTNPTFSNSLWSAGLYTVAGVESRCYAPPKELRGSLARVYFYMAALYHVNNWSVQGFTMMDGRAYPGLTDYAVDMLLDWHRTHPAGAAEISANERAAVMQGNTNPFVDYPELAEHLWGRSKDSAFVIEDEPQPLRGTYTLDDGQIDLWSPYVPVDASWSVDGQPVTESFISTASLGVGDHVLAYSSRSTGENGRVMIKIRVR